MNHDLASRSEGADPERPDGEELIGIGALGEWLREPEHTQTVLAAAIARFSGVRLTQAGVSRWFKRGEIPPKRVRAVSVVTGIPKCKLRPDLFDEKESGGSV